MAKILIVEDDAIFVDRLSDWLTAQHYLVDIAPTGEEALKLLDQRTYDLLIIDWLLPKLTGIEVLRQFRASGGKTPVLMLTGKDYILEKTTGLDSGADDYLTKPFHAEELSARIRALLRRPATLTGNTLRIGSLALDPRRRQVTLNGQEIHLLPLEFSLLEFLVRHPDLPFTAEQLVERVWHSDTNASPQVVRTYVHTLRKKITIDASRPVPIRTKYGAGYMLVSSQFE